LSIEKILEYLEQEGIHPHGIYQLQDGTTFVISMFPNGRVYIYNNIPDYELSGPYQTIEEARTKLQDCIEVWKEEAPPSKEKVDEITEVVYEITFILTHDTNDRKKAQAYLNEDNFTPYIQDKVSESTSSKLKKVQYKLKGSRYGGIYITTNSILEDTEKKELKSALSDFQTNELNDGWSEQEFAIVGCNISEFKPLSTYGELKVIREGM